MSFQILFLLLLNSITPSRAYPYEGFPFQEQLPDIARVGEDYSFTINSQTFKSDDSSDDSISYEAYDLPTWLSFDSSSLKFTGSPTDTDTTGEISFILEGTDAQGSLNQSCTIYLSDQPSPELNEEDNVMDQLATMGTTNGYNGIVVDPSTSFTFTFDSDTFQIPSSSDNTIVAYYGKSANRTSLPSWCFFDSSSLTFYGTSPAITSEDAPSLQYELTLIATDYDGYSAVYSDFKIVVGGHNLYLNSTYNNTLSVNPGEAFTIDLPLESIYLDNSQIETSQIGSVVIYNSPSWVAIDDNSVLAGTVPEDQTSNIVVNVTLYDTYGDSVYMNFDIEVVHEIFTVDSLDNITVTDGTFFEYTLPSSDFKNETATDIDAYFDASWLTFYHSNNTFVGQVPDGFDYTYIELDASINSLSETRTFYIVGKAVSSSSRRSSSTRASSSSSYASSSSYSSYRSSSSYVSASSSYGSSSRSSIVSATSSASSSIASSVTSSSAAASSSGVLVVSDKSTSSSKKGLAIGLGVAIPLAAIIAAAIIFFFCCCGKRRKNKNEEEGKTDDGGIPPAGTGPYMMDKVNSSNDTITSARMLAEKNLTTLEKDSEQSSYYSVAQATLTSNSNHNLYQAANMQVSTDKLLEDSSINANGGVYNSWRKSSAGNLKARDSLSSLATVATNDLLTVNVINENKVRKSQMIFPKMSKLRINNSSESMIGSDSSSTSDLIQFPTNNNKLNSLREEHNISREGSSHSISSQAQLVGFKNSGSVSRKIQREEKSCRGELYNIGDDSSYGDDDSGSN